MERNDDVPRKPKEEMEKELLQIIAEDENPFEMATYLLNAVRQLLNEPKKEGNPADLV